MIVLTCCVLAMHGGGSFVGAETARGMHCHVSAARGVGDKLKISDKQDRGLGGKG